MNLDQLKLSLKEIEFLFCGILLWIFIFLPILTVVYLPLLIWRFLIVIPLAKIFHPELIPLHRMDSLLFLKPSDQNPVANACQVWRLQGEINIDEFRKHFHKCFLSSEEDEKKYENLYCYLEEFMGYIFKKRIQPSELDLTKMIKQISIEDLSLLQHQWQLHEDDQVKLDDNDSIVNSFIGNWMAKNTYRSESPSWEILIVQPSSSTNKDDENEIGSVVLFKIDHSLCDGYSFIHLADKLSNKESPYLFRKKELSWRKRLKYLLQGPGILFFWIWARTSKECNLFFPKKVSKPQWFISFTNLDLELVKSIRRKTKTHFVTVLMSIMAGAMRTFLLESGKVSKEQELPGRMTTGHSLGWPNHPAMSQTSKRKLGNHLSMGIYQIPLAEKDPLKRLITTDNEYLEFERLGAPEVMNWILFSMILVQPAKLNRYIWRMSLKWGFMRFTYFFSALMLSSESYSLLGVHVNKLSFPLVLTTTAPTTDMFTILTSHSGQLELSINASSEIFQNRKQLEHFTQVYFEKELKRLEISLKTHSFNNSLCL